MVNFTYMNVIQRTFVMAYAESLMQMLNILHYTVGTPLIFLYVNPSNI
jgi:hypothetical protein